MKLPRLIPGWQRAHRLWTIRLAVAMLLLNLAGALMELLAEDFPSRIWLYLNTLLGGLIVLVRVLQQAGALDMPAAALSPEVPPDPPAPTDPLAADETLFRHPSER